MASIVLEVPNEVGQRVVDGFALRHSWQPTIPNPDGGEDIPNPESKFAFMGRLLSEFVMDSVAYAEGFQASNDAREAAEESARNDIVISVSQG